MKKENMDARKSLLFSKVEFLLILMEAVQKVVLNAKMENVRNVILGINLFKMSNRFNNSQSSSKEEVTNKAEKINKVEIISKAEKINKEEIISKEERIKKEEKTSKEKLEEKITKEAVEPKITKVRMVEINNLKAVLKTTNNRIKINKKPSMEVIRINNNNKVETRIRINKEELNKINKLKKKEEEINKGKTF